MDEDGSPSALDVAAAGVAAPAAAAMAAALLGASAGRLSVGLALAAAAGAAVAVAWWAGRARPGVAAADIVTLAVVAAAGLHAAPAATPWPSFLDASWYVGTGAVVARTGALVQPLEDWPAEPGARRALVATFGDLSRAGVPGVPVDETRGFHAVAFAVPDVSEAVAVPYHPPAFAAWVAAVVRLVGPLRSGGAVVAWSLAWLLAAAALARALGGPAAGALAAAALAVSPAFTYFGRTPYAETAGGALLLGGLAALVAVGRSRGPGPAAAAAAGAALGTAALVKADLLLPLAPLAVWWLLARRREGGPREGLALAASAGVPLALLAWQAGTISRTYFALNGSGLSALSVPTGIPPLVATLAWFATPLGLWAAVAGIAAAVADRDRAAGAPLAVALLAVPVVLATPAVTETLSSMYAGRRLVPYALPLAAAFASAAAARAWDRAPWGRGGRALVGGGAALVLAASALNAAPLAQLREFAGGARAAAALDALAGEGDVFLFDSVLAGDYAGRMAAALWGLHGRTIAVIGPTSPDASALGDAVRAWHGRGRRVLLVADDPAHLPAVDGFEPRQVGETAVLPPVLAPEPGLPPRQKSPPLELRFVVYELTPLERTDRTDAPRPRRTGTPRPRPGDPRLTAAAATPL